MNVSSLNNYSLDLHFDSSAGFHIQYWGESAEHKAHPLHKHSFLECCYVTRGLGVYIEDGQRFPLQQGDCFLTRPGTWHCIKSMTGIGLTWVGFELKHEISSAAYKEKYRQLIKTKRFMIPSHSPTITTSLWQTLTNMASTEQIDSQLLKHLTYSLILSFFHTFLEEKNIYTNTPRPHGSIVLREAKLFIQDNMSLRIKFQDLAEYLHISERQLSRLFKEQLGESFSSYYRKIKIQTATSLLESTDMTLEQIATETGFYSVHHFTKVFKQTLGAPPGQWRKGNRK